MEMTLAYLKYYPKQLIILDKNIKVMLVFLLPYNNSGYRRLNTISNNELAEMATHVRILLKKFHFVPILNVHRLMFYHSALQCLAFEYDYLKEYELSLLYRAHLTNKLLPLKLLTKLLMDQQLLVKLRL